MKKSKEVVSKTVQSVAEEMYKNIVLKKRSDGSEFYCNIKEIEWQKDIIYKAHGERLPDDYIYEFIIDALAALYDCKEGNENEAIAEIKADCYTSDLTKWLHSSNNRVYYLIEALEEGLGITDGFQLSSYAQQKEKHEVACLVLDGIKEYIENL